LKKRENRDDLDFFTNERLRTLSEKGYRFLLELFFTNLGLMRI
jgi:hypothetical protein